MYHDMVFVVGKQTLSVKLALRVFNASSYEMPLFMHSIQLKGLKIANSINKRMRFHLNIYRVLFGFEKITVGHFDNLCRARSQTCANNGHVFKS